MTKILFATMTALMLTVGIVGGAQAGYGQQAQTGAYAAGGTASSTPMNDGGGAR